MRSEAQTKKALWKAAAGAALALLAGCSSLPKVTPVSYAQAAEPPVVISANGPETRQDGRQEVREVEAEGRASLLKHHIGMLGSLGEFTTADNEVRLLVDGPATFKSMFSDLERARRSIEMESYIFEDAELGHRVATVLKKKARAGVEVRLIYDAVLWRRRANSSKIWLRPASWSANSIRSALVFLSVPTN